MIQQTSVTPGFSPHFMLCYSFKLYQLFYETTLVLWNRSSEIVQNKKKVTRFWEQCLVWHFYMFCKTQPRHGCWPCSAEKYFMSDFYFPQKPKYFKLQLLLPPGNSVSPPKPPPDSSEHLSVLTYRFAVLCFININGYYIRCQLWFFLTSGMVQFKSLGSHDKRYCQQHNGPRPVLWACNWSYLN